MNKTIRLEKYHIEWIDKKMINLSKYVRRKIDEDIKRDELI